MNRSLGDQLTGVVAVGLDVGCVGMGVKGIHVGPAFVHDESVVVRCVLRVAFALVRSVCDVDAFVRVAVVRGLCTYWLYRPLPCEALLLRRGLVIVVIAVVLAGCQ